MGSLEECTAASPRAKVTQLRDTILLPGFIDPHSHPIVSGVVTQAPAI